MAIGTEMERSWPQIARSYLWFREIDAALAALHIELNLTDLLCRGPLFNIPTPDDFPALGWWTADDVAAERFTVIASRIQLAAAGALAVCVAVAGLGLAPRTAPGAVD